MFDLKSLQNRRMKFSSESPFTSDYVTSHLTQSSDPGGMYANRVRGRQMLLENPARESRAKKQQDEKKARQIAEKEKKKHGVIGKREAKEKGVWRFDETQAKSVIFYLFAIGLLTRC